ncbi:MAG TPA: recombinase family protein, partial [Firmicutes bacterium]|nr:recombinase family protein [Bacillota bacterium]
MIGIYVRVSTEEQAKQGFSIPAQIRECRKLVGKREAHVFVDRGISGETLNRPGL